MSGFIALVSLSLTSIQSEARSYHPNARQWVWQICPRYSRHDVISRSAVRLLMLSSEVAAGEGGLLLESRRGLRRGQVVLAAPEWVAYSPDAVRTK